MAVRCEAIFASQGLLPLCVVGVWKDFQPNKINIFENTV
jgi:hypothetical protein